MNYQSVGDFISENIISTSPVEDAGDLLQIFRQELKWWDAKATDQTVMKVSILEFLFRNATDRSQRRQELPPTLPVYWRVRVERQTIVSNPHHVPKYHERWLSIEVTGRTNYNRQVFTVRENKKKGRYGTLSVRTDDRPDVLLLGSAKYEVMEWVDAENQSYFCLVDYMFGNQISNYEEK